MNSLKTLLCSFLLVGFVGFANAAVDINTADQATLQTIKGIGPAKAEEIIKYRTEKGPFKSVDDLKNVKGIGAKVLEAIKNDVTVGGGAVVPKPEEKKPAEAKPADKAPAKVEEKKPAEAKPADKAPAKAEEKKPVEAKPADKAPAKAEEKKPAEAKPADKAPAKVEEKKPVTPTPNKM